MKSNNSFRWVALVSANVLAWCMLCFHQNSTAAPPPGAPPFANAIEQRLEMIEQLKQVNALLKEQNTLLKSGALQVVLAEKG
jgi:hypothetical protein